MAGYGSGLYGYGPYKGVSYYLFSDCTDSYVWEDAPNSNYGLDPTLTLSNYEQASRRFGLFTWQLPVYPTLTIDSAYIFLNCQTGGMNLPQGPFNVYFVNSNCPWTESGVTYYHYNEFSTDGTRNRWHGHGILDSTNFDPTSAGSVLFDQSGQNVIALNSYGASKLETIINTDGSWNGFIFCGSNVNQVAQWNGQVVLDSGDSTTGPSPQLLINV